MTKLERRLRSAGGVLIRCSKHRIYLFQGKRYILPHSKQDDKEYMKKLRNILNEAESK